jgi:hypothetical protein
VHHALPRRSNDRKRRWDELTYEVLVYWLKTRKPHAYNLRGCCKQRFKG